MQNTNNIQRGRSIRHPIPSCFYQCPTECRMLSHIYLHIDAKKFTITSLLQPTDLTCACMFSAGFFYTTDRTVQRTMEIPIHLSISAPSFAILVHFLSHCLVSALLVRRRIAQYSSFLWRLFFLSHETINRAFCY